MVREDLPPGVAAAQIAHAAGESSPGNLPEGTYAVVLGTLNERRLAAFADWLETQDVAPKRIVEVDRPWSGQLMAIGITPAPRSKLRGFFAQLPLYRGSYAGVDERSQPARDDAVSTTATGTR